MQHEAGIHAVWRFYPNNTGLRPFGVSFLFAGWDDVHGYQLYHSDPSGNYSGWKATCIGSNSTNGSSMLKSDYKPEMSLKEAKSLAVKVLSKTMDGNSLSSEKSIFILKSGICSDFKKRRESCF